MHSISYLIGIFPPLFPSQKDRNLPNVDLNDYGNSHGTYSLQEMLLDAIQKYGSKATVNPKETVGGRNQEAACSAALRIQ